MDRIKAVLSQAPLDASCTIARADLKRFVRFQSAYCLRLFDAVNKAAVEAKGSEEGAKKNSTIPDLAIHQLLHTCQVVAQLGPFQLNHLCALMLPASQRLLHSAPPAARPAGPRSWPSVALCVRAEAKYRENVANLTAMYPDSWTVGIHSFVTILRDRVAQLIDYQRFRGAQSYLSLVSFLVSHALADGSPFSVERKAEVSQWALALLEKAISHAAVVRGLVHLLSQVYDDSKVWSLLAKDLQLVQGSIERDEARHTTTVFRAVHSETVTAVATQVCNALQCCMDDVDVLVQQVKALSRVQAKEGQRQRWETLTHSSEAFFDEACDRLRFVCEVLLHLDGTRLEGTAVEWVVKALSRAFKLLTAVTKAVYRAGKNPRPSFSALCESAVQRLSPATTAFVLHITGADGTGVAGEDESTVRRRHAPTQHKRPAE